MNHETMSVPQENDGWMTPLLEGLVARLLEGLGHNLDMNGLRDTPARVMRDLIENLQANGDPIEEAIKQLKVFDAPENGGLVNVKSGFASRCEHHLVPFFGTVQVVYLPDKQVTGLSKISRALDVLSKRPQIQERITAQLGDVMMHLEPVGVLVDVIAEHMCMRCRGINDPLSVTRTRVVRGQFAMDVDLRNQAVSMLM